MKPEGATRIRCTHLMAINMTAFAAGDEVTPGMRMQDGEIITEQKMADMVSTGLWVWVSEEKREAAAQAEAKLTDHTQRQRRLDGDAADPVSEAPSEALRAEERVAQEEAEAADDDLTDIKGLGVATAAALQRAGVRTFAQLAHMDADYLGQILAAVPGAGARGPEFKKAAQLILKASAQVDST